MKQCFKHNFFFHFYFYYTLIISTDFMDTYYVFSQILLYIGFIITVFYITFVLWGNTTIHLMFVQRYLGTVRSAASMAKMSWK